MMQAMIGRPDHDPVQDAEGVRMRGMLIHLHDRVHGDVDLGHDRGEPEKGGRRRDDHRRRDNLEGMGVGAEPDVELVLEVMLEVEAPQESVDVLHVVEQPPQQLDDEETAGELHGEHAVPAHQGEALALCEVRDEAHARHGRQRSHQVGEVAAQPAIEA